MRGMLGTLAALAAALSLLGVAQAEEGPTRAEYVAAVEPICEANTRANKRILRGARTKVRKGRLPAAGNQFRRAARAFGKTVQKIVAVPRPPADEARLQKWFKFLRIVRANLNKIGVQLKKRDRVRANHEAVRAERSANAANNVGSIFNFRYCRLTPSRFSGT